MDYRAKEIRDAIDLFDIEHARELLKTALKNPTGEIYYLASLVAIDNEQKTEFLEKSVELDPFHQEANTLLEEISKRKNAQFIQPIDNEAQDNINVESSEGLEKEARTVMQVIFAPLLDYRDAAKKIFNYQNLTREDIISITTEEVTSSILGAMIIVAIEGQLLGGILGLEPADFLHITDTLFINEIVQVLMFLGIAWLNAIIFHYPFKKVGGIGTFRQTYLANVLTMAVMLPIILPASWIAVRLGLTGYEVSSASLYILIDLEKKIHDLPKKQYVWGCVLSSIFLIIIFVPIGFIIAWIISNSP